MKKRLQHFMIKLSIKWIYKVYKIKVLSRVENTMEQSGETYKIVKKVYSFKNSTHIIVSAILLVISTAYLILISVQERLITKCLSVSYMVCGIMTFLISFTIILGLTAMASST